MEFEEGKEWDYNWKYIKEKQKVEVVNVYVF